MAKTDEKTRRFAVNSIYPSFLYAVFGVVLAQAGATQMHGSWRLHVFLGLPGIALAGLALYRAHLHWSGSANIPTSRPRVFGWYFLLLAAGVFVGVVVSAGSVLLLFMVATITYLLPWAKIPVCRARFVGSSLAILAGAIAWVVFYRKQAHSLYYMLAAWILFVPPMFTQFLVVVSLDTGYRIPSAGFADSPELDVPASLPQ